MGGSSEPEEQKECSAGMCKAGCGYGKISDDLDLPIASADNVEENENSKNTGGLYD